MGPCGTQPGDSYRIDHLEKLCDLLPDEQGDFQSFYSKGNMQRTPYMEPEDFKNFNFLRANLYRVYGDNWYKKMERNLLSYINE